VAVVVSQDNADPGGWKLDLFASYLDSDGSEVFIDTITLSAPNATVKRPSRVVAIMSLPGAHSWKVIVRPPTPAPAAALSVGVFAGEVTALPFTLVQP
jgi:hypothetical protein